MTLAEPEMTNPMEVFEIGAFLHAKGDFEESIPYYQKALKLAEPLGDLEITRNILTNLGTALSDCGELDQAIYCLKEALVIDRQRNDRENEVTHLIQIGEIHLQQGDLVEGAKFAKSALSLLKDGVEKELSEKEQIEKYFAGFIETLYYRLRSENLILYFTELLE